MIAKIQDQKPYKRSLCIKKFIKSKMNFPVSIIFFIDLKQRLVYKINHNEFICNSIFGLNLKIDTKEEPW